MNAINFDEYHKKLAVGRAAAQADVTFSPDTAVRFGADPALAARVECSGHFYLIQYPFCSDEMKGYLAGLNEIEAANQTAQDDWFLNHPSA